jgi:uncharacterized protein
MLQYGVIMLIEFSVGNYRSFKERVTLSMVAAKIKSQPERLDADNVFRVDDDLTLLKSAAIYGANASGKSNLIAALGFMRQFVLNSSRDSQVGERIGVEPFLLNTETVGQPSHFEIVFLLDGIIHRYGFEVTAERVVAEWLYHTPGRKEANLFERSDKIERKRTFKEGRDLEKRTRSNALYVSVVAQFNGELASAIVSWFARLGTLLGLTDVHQMMQAMHFFEDATYQPAIIEFIRRFDVGIDDIAMQRSPAKPPALPSDAPEELRRVFDILSGIEGAEHIAVQTLHPCFDASALLVETIALDLEQHESDGTRKLFAFAYPILRTLREGLVLVIDELDARLHPLITRQLIKLFNSQETNPHNAQLIFTTHDTNLLSGMLFRRDQIWFVEKSRRGESTLYSLVEYRQAAGKKIRNDASFEKDYIAGRYGAIPYIGSFDALPGIADGETVA